MCFLKTQFTKPWNSVTCIVRPMCYQIHQTSHVLRKKIFLLKTPSAPTDPKSISTSADRQHPISILPLLCQLCAHINLTRRSFWKGTLKVDCILIQSGYGQEVYIGDTVKHTKFVSVKNNFSYFKNWIQPMLAYETRVQPEMKT